MNKKLLGITLSTVIAVSSFTPIMAEDTITFSGSSVYVSAGEEFLMPFTAENAENLKNCTIELSFNDEYITPVIGSVSNKGSDTYIQDIAVSPGRVIIVAGGINTKDYGNEIFSYKFKVSPELTKEITAGISITVTNADGNFSNTCSTVNGTVNINKSEPISTPNIVLPSDEENDINADSQKTQTISVASIDDKQYGDAPFSLSVTPDSVSGLTDMTYTSSDENIATVTADGTVILNGSGVCKITVSQNGNEDYKPAETSVSFTVNKKLLKVYPNDLTITYGDALPQNLIAFDGFVNTQDEDELSKQVIVSGLPENITPGTYALSLSGIVSDKYKIDYSEGTLTIAPKTLTVENLKVYDKIADGNNTALIDSSSAVLSGINTGDDVKLNLGSASAEFVSSEAGENVEVKISGLSLTGKDAEKYTLSSTEFTTSANIKSEMTASDVAASINSVIPVEKDSRSLVLPYVGSGFTVSVASTSNSNLIDTDGHVGYADTDTDVTLVFSVSKNDDIAQTVPVTVTVPASTKVTLSQAPLSGDIFGLGTFFKGEDVTLNVGNGYKVKAWYINDTKYDTNDTTIKLTAEEDMVIKAETYQHNGGSLQGNAAAKVTSSISSGKILAGSLVELKTSTSGADIYYTTDGSSPSTLSEKYIDKIEISQDTVIKAIAVKKGMSNSSVSTFSYTVRYAKTELKNNANKIKYMASYADNTFRPDQAATRYEVIDALNNLLDIEESGNKKTFSDVDEKHEEVVSTFAGVGIISGYGNGTFGGNKSITRAEFVTLLTKAWNTEGISSKKSFNDINGHWAAEMIETFAANGYVSGYPDGGFHPDDKVTRAEVVSVINRMVGTTSVSLSQKYIDLAPTHWAYGQIMAVVS